MQLVHGKVRKTNRTATLALCVVLLCLLSINAWSQEDAKPRLEVVSDGKIWVQPAGKLRLHFSGDDSKGYDVAFETKEGENWSAVAAFPAGKVWVLYDQWNKQQWDPRWYSGEYGFRASEIRLVEPGTLECSGRGEVGGQPWEFRDLYAFEHGAFKLTRHWHHASPQDQSSITLANVLRVPVGEDPRVLIPAVLYNDNPGAYPTRQVPHLPMIPFARGLYEEHRLPVPFVNLESTIAKRQRYASLLTVPSRVPQAHKGDDQWWSLGLQWHWGGQVDLMLVSGAVSTNGMNSIVYGHVNGFDPYENAYIDVKGDSTFEKTLYVDCGVAARKGYAFRETLWKAYDVFQPRVTPILSFAEAMNLKFKYAAETYLETPDGAAGFPLAYPPVVPLVQRFEYGWVGRNLEIAYAFLKEADRTGNEQYRRMGMNTVRTFVERVRRDVPGLFFMDYDYVRKQWLTFLGLPDWPASISSRQLGDTLDDLAELVQWGKARGLPEASRWQALLVEAGDFLVTTKRYKGMYPRTWYPDGRAVGWDGDTPGVGTVSTAGAHLVAPLAKLYKLTNDRRYLETAESVMRAYYHEYGLDLKHSYAGATLDAASEDKEAAQGMLHGAVALYEVTQKPEYLDYARDAADWHTTWYYMYDVQMPESSPLHGILNSVGYTSVSVYLHVLDSACGAFVAVDFYKLGKYINDKRYQEIGRSLFESSLQTIARPDRMVGLPRPGMQYEHFNQTNFTYLAGGAWRGGGHTPSISWILAVTLYYGTKMAELGVFTW
jgi:hypothetical protein